MEVARKGLWAAVTQKQANKKNRKFDYLASGSIKCDKDNSNTSPN